jgi:hypothetical protein
MTTAELFLGQVRLLSARYPRMPRPSALDASGGLVGRQHVPVHGVRKGNLLEPSA